jgi:hypothetical protein
MLEYKDARVEIGFFKRNEALGEYVHWPLVGDLIPPDTVPAAKRAAMARNLSAW